MNRLRDMDGVEPLFRRGVDVLRETPPTPEVAAMKLRVWRASRRTPATPARGFNPLVFKQELVPLVCRGAEPAGAVIHRR